MKKTGTTIILALAATLIALFNSCNEVAPVDHQNSSVSIVPQSLDLSKYEVRFTTPDAASSTFVVRSTNVEWEITGIPDWITIDPKTGGAGQVTVNVKVTENTATSNRVGLLSFKSIDDSWSYAKTLTVSQSRARLYAIPEKNRIEFDGSAQTATIKVTSNTDNWTVSKSTNHSWCSVSKGDGCIDISVTANVNDVSNECQIIISTQDGDEYITVFQRPANISSTLDKLDYGVAGGTKTVKISAEAPWTASTSYSWINVTPSTGNTGETTVSIEVTANNSLQQRNGYVYVALSSSNKIEIPVSQDCITFNVDNTQFEVPITGQQYQLKVKSNVQWKVLDSVPAWMSIDPKAGTTDAVLSMNVTSNTSYNERNATFRIAPVSLTNAAIEIKVHQVGLKFETDSTALHFPDKASSSFFNIETDGSWIVTPSAEWITLDKELGTGNSRITVSVTENTADTVRSGYIIAAIEGRQDKIDVYQQGKYFNVSSSALEFTSKGGSTLLSIKTNNSWTANASDEWINLDKTEGENDCDLTITATDNASLIAREGYVDITPKDYNPIRISVKQDPRYLTVSVDTLFFFAKGGTSDPVIIDTDGNAEITTDAEWLAINRESATQITITVTKNEEELFRTGIITIRLDDLKDGTMSLNVVVRQLSEMHNGHEFVDLGLSVKWATCNVGSLVPEGVGNYYAWGETDSKDDYSWGTYLFGNEAQSLTKYCLSADYGKDGFMDNKTTLELVDDVARIEWGGFWRIPTKEEFEELVNNCSFTSTTKNGVDGYEIRSQIAGYEDQSIFLPTTGYKMSIYTYDEERYWYWTSSIDNQFSSGAWTFVYDRPIRDFFSLRRYYGLPVRPVCSRKTIIENITIDLNKDSISIFLKETFDLLATVKNNNAVIDCGVNWSTGDPTVATVSKSGIVTGICAGTTTITATCLGQTATCKITVTEPTPEYVDLGLSVNWATYNVGAIKSIGLGDYYAWGETEPKTDYSSSTYKWNGSDKYASANRTLDLDDDVAHVKWGGSWRMPDKAEFDELRKKCTWTWTTVNGVTGYLITSKISGYEDRSIFLPAGGSAQETTQSNVGSYGFYWSSSTEQPTTSYEYYFTSSVVNVYGAARYIGMSVRPVSPSQTWLSNMSITLNKQSYSMVISDTCTLTVTVKHDSEVLDRLVTWSTGNPAIATVSETGFVTGISTGTTTITATCLGKTATCTITIAEPTPEYVDLGLSVNWATYNVGAIKPIGLGNYYAWGETEPKTDYSSSTYKWNGSDKYASSNRTLDLDDDVAHVQWGGNWRMPDKAEFDELRKKCTWTWTTVNGVTGYRITSKISGYEDRSIFLPAGGNAQGNTQSSVDSYGYYWSSSTDQAATSYEYYFNSSVVNVYGAARFIGMSVRPVIPSEAWLSDLSITLSTGSLSLLLDQVDTLKATVKHGNDALDRIVVWSSADPSIVTVSESGMVTAISVGTTIVTATCLGKTATCNIHVMELSPISVSSDSNIGVNTYTDDTDQNSGTDADANIGATDYPTDEDQNGGNGSGGNINVSDYTDDEDLN
ncbi:MAG: Ig-like domain-containing protein [Bacteroidaceae bacterium]|nr:Ig-like domain-containing protein [Bacteroidaceae bacterium]